MVEQLTSQDFRERVINGRETALVDFFATWCGPCKRQAPILEEFAEEVAQKDPNFHIYKVDVDLAQDVASEYGVMSIPTICMFVEGSVVEREQGLHSKEELKKIAGF